MKDKILSIPKILLAILFTALLLNTSNSFSSIKDSKSSKVLINEILYLTGEVGRRFPLHEHQWVEIYNSGPDSIDLTGWIISASSGQDISIPSWILPPGSFLTFHQAEGTNDNDFEDLDGHYFTGDSTEIFNDSEDECALYSGSPDTSTIVDFVCWTSNGSYSPGTGHDYAAAVGIWTSGDFYDSQNLSFADCLSRYFDGYDRDLSSDWRTIRWTLYAHNPALQPENPIQELPVNRSVIDNDTPKFDWSVFADADSFQIQVDNNWDFSSPEIDAGGITVSEYTPASPLSNDAYFHRVRAYVDGTPTPWAAEWLVVIQTTGLKKSCDDELHSCRHKYQRKDTKLLCIWTDVNGANTRPGCPEIGDYAWNKPHPDRAPPDVETVHGTNYCWAASIAMVNDKYGGDLNQDRIAYQNWNTTRPQPEGDLGHARRATDGQVTAILSWALQGAAINYVPRFPPQSFTFNELKGWIDQLDCFVGGVPGHCLVLDGYAQLTSSTGSNIQVVYAQDPWLGPNHPHVFSYIIEGAPGRYRRRHRRNVFDAVWLQPAAGVKAQMQEASVKNDSDKDGVMDFDEEKRFCSLVNDKDSDDDQVLDNLEIRSYTFHDTDHGGHENNPIDFPDIDNDTLRAECDCDSDNDGDFDGGEDINGNGKSPEAGETCVYDRNQNLLRISVDKDVYFVGEPVYIVDETARMSRTYHANSTYNYEKGKGCPDKVDNTPLNHSGSFKTNSQGRALKTKVEDCPAPGKYYLTVDVLNDKLYSEPDNTDPQTCWECVELGVEVDYFPYSLAKVTAEMPIIGTDTITLNGPTKVYVYFDGSEGRTKDTDDDGLDQVQTEMVELELSGTSSLLGPVTVRLRDHTKCPFKKSTGQIEEMENTEKGRLDLPPFADYGYADSFFDVYFELEVNGAIFHTHDPKHMETIISYKPPWEGETYENLEEIELFNESENPTGIKITSTHHTPTPIHIYKEQGWSLTSLPVYPENNDLSLLFPEADIFGFDAARGYYPMNILESHEGFWLNLPDSNIFIMDGIPVYEYETRLPQGWSIIGGIFSFMGFIHAEPQTAVEAIFAFNQEFGYIPAEYIYPGESVWIKCNKACIAYILPAVYTLQKTISSDTTQTAKITATGEEVGTRVNISSVVIGIDTSEADVKYAPPAPPEYTTQIRLFAVGDFTNAYYSDIRESTNPQQQEIWVLELDPDGNTPNPPGGRTTRLTWDANDLISIADDTWVLREGTDGTGTVIVEDMRTTTSIDVTGTSEKYFTIASPFATSIQDNQKQKIPLKFELSQNYPNPFNPETVINYQLPRPAKVTIEIYNIYGQKIKTLISEQKKAGYFTAVWDSRNNLGNIVSTGVYFYRMDADAEDQHFIQIRKMILLR